MRLVFFNNVASIDDASTSYDTPKDVPDEKISILDVDGNGNLDLTGANATSRMKLVMGNSKGLAVQSPIIKKKDIIDVHTIEYRAAVKQVTNVGYDGDTGDIPVNAGENYRLKIVNLLGLEETGSEPLPRVNANYVAEDGDTPLDIATALVSKANQNSSFFAVAEALSAQASSQLVDDDGTPANVTLDVTEGSKTVVANVTAGADVNASAGDYLRIGHATEDEYPVYQIASIEANGGAQTELEIELERAYAGDTDAGVAVGKLDADPDADDAAGIQLTAKEYTTSFNTALSDAFGSTSPEINSTPDVGSGRYEQAKEAEENAQGAESFFYRQTIYNGEKPRFFADESLDYDVVVVRVDSAITPNIAKNTELELHLFFKEGELDSAGADLATFFGV